MRWVWWAAGVGPVETWTENRVENTKGARALQVLVK